MTVGSRPGGLVMRRGDRGPAVAEVRARLARLGLLPGSKYAVAHAEDDRLRAGPLADVVEPAEWETTQLISAEFDESVEAAVRAFQERRGITVDGIVGPETFRRLEEARWRLGDRMLSYAAAHPTMGEDVLELQRRLNAMGFSCGKEDGSLGPVTDNAIREFQHNTGIRTDGVCGPATFRALGQLRRTVGRESGHNVRERESLQKMRTGVRGKVVVLDPTVPNHYYTPRTTPICTDIASRVEGKLNPLGTQVVVTQPLSGAPADQSDEGVRARFCNSLGADLVISLVVADDASHPAGASTYYYGQSDGVVSVPGQLAARMLLEGITERTDLTDCSEHGRTWDLLRLTRMPAVRVRCGNLAHPEDARRLSDPVFADALAKAISDAVVRFFSP